MRFLYKSGESIRGRLSYIDRDQAINFEPVKEVYKPGRHGPSAALVADKTLQIEFLVDSGCLLYVWGYLPKEGWQDGASQFSLDSVQPGIVFVKEIDDMVMPGAAYTTNLASAQAHYSNKSGYLVIGRPEDADALVEIATDTIIGLKDDQLCCVVLKPTMS